IYPPPTMSLTKLMAATTLMAARGNGARVTGILLVLCRVLDVVAGTQPVAEPSRSASPPSSLPISRRHAPPPLARTGGMPPAPIILYLNAARAVLPRRRNERGP